MAMDIYAVWSSTRQDEAGIADRCSGAFMILG
jgi:hypothetical protein